MKHLGRVKGNRWLPVFFADTEDLVPTLSVAIKIAFTHGYLKRGNMATMEHNVNIQIHPFGSVETPIFIRSHSFKYRRLYNIISLMFLQFYRKQLESGRLYYYRC